MPAGFFFGNSIYSMSTYDWVPPKRELVTAWPATTTVAASQTFTTTPFNTKAVKQLKVLTTSVGPNISIQMQGSIDNANWVSLATYSTQTVQSPVTLSDSYVRFLISNSSTVTAATTAAVMMVETL